MTLINALVYVRASRRIEFEFGVLVFVEEGNLVKQGQKNIETRTTTTTNQPNCDAESRNKTRDILMIG